MSEKEATARNELERLEMRLSKLSDYAEVSARANADLAEAQAMVGEQAAIAGTALSRMRREIEDEQGLDDSSAEVEAS